MAAGDLLTADWQVEYNGLLFDNTTTYRIVDIDGLSMPEMRINDTPRPQRHGEFASDQYLNGRTIEMTINVVANTTAALISALDDLGVATNPLSQDLIPFVIRFPTDEDRLIYARCVRRRFPIRNEFITSKVARVDLQFKAPDPTIYSLTASSTATSGGTSSGGHDISDHTFPHGFGTATPSSISAVNEGNWDVWPVFRVAASGGSVTSCSIDNITTGETFLLATTIADAQYVDVDMDNRTVLLDGTASRIGDVTRPNSEWIHLTAGNNTINFAYSGGGTGTLSLTYRSGWLY